MWELNNFLVKLVLVVLDKSCVTRLQNSWSKHCPTRTGNRVMLVQGTKALTWKGNSFS